MGGKMKTKKIITIFFVLLFVQPSLFYSQVEKGYDEKPTPIGGMEAIAKNVVYPEAAKKDRIQGKVFVRAVVDESGEVVEVKITKGSNEMLNKAAAQAVLLAKFYPAEKNGKKLKSFVTIPVVFKLE